MKSSNLKLPPLLEIAVNPLILQEKSAKNPHKNSKSVSFPQIYTNNLTSNFSTIESTQQDSQLINEKSRLIFKKDIVKIGQKTHHSPLKRLLLFSNINYSDKNDDNSLQKPNKTSEKSRKTPIKTIKASSKFFETTKKHSKTKETEQISNKKLIDISLPNFPERPSDKNIDSSFSRFLSQKDLMLYWAKTRNSSLILSQLHENLYLSCQLNSLKLLTDTIYLIGDLHLCDGDLEVSVYAYLHMKILCDLTENFHMKILAILALANCCKILKKNTQALFLYKKALEYVWKIKDEETEAKIYDRIGMIYFHFGEIRKARYYHDRSLEFKLESDTSPAKYSSANSLRKYHESLKSQHFNSITPVLLGKLGISFQETITNSSKENIVKKPENSYEQNHDISSDNSSLFANQIPKVKFSTNLKIEALLENLFYEKDFNYEIPSPRYPRGYSEQDILLGRTDVLGISKRPKNESNSTVFSMNQLNLLNMNSQKTRKPIIRIDLDPMLMKIPISEKIKLRSQILRHLKNKEKVLDSKLNGNKKIKASEFIGFGIYYNHLTPNRNIEAFNYLYKNKQGKLEKYYRNLDKIEEGGEDGEKLDKLYGKSLEELEYVD